MYCPRPQAAANMTKILVISDTHIMGPWKSTRFDKFIREYEMRRSFVNVNDFYKPDLIIFLGDLMDEAARSYDDTFRKAAQEFDTIFEHNQDTKWNRIVVPGNHDVGFHDHMTQYSFLLDRFSKRYESPLGAELRAFADLSFIALNSMSMSNDSCPFCQETDRELESITRKLTSRPIILSHIPLYRGDDSSCPSAPSELRTKTNKEGRDVLHKTKSESLLAKIKPRLVISGHTHLHCVTHHQIPGIEEPFQEVTVSSFSHKYAYDSAGFLLISANSTQMFIEHCSLLGELTRLVIVIVTILLICLIQFCSG